MNIQRTVRKTRKGLHNVGKRLCIFGRNLRKRDFQNRHIYAIYIVAATVVCLFAAQFAPGSSFRSWYYNLINKPIINKEIQHMTDDRDGQEMKKGTFLTHYRYAAFGATNPEEVDPNAPMIALTFDDGPNPDYTQRILDVLTANYSHATFFVVGPNAESFTETLKAISLAGCEIGNHTYNHKDLTTLTAAEVEEQIDKVNRAVKKSTGENTTVIRPPYGAFNDDVLAQLKEPVILWDLDTEDWDSRNAQKVVEKVLDTVKDGDIVLMHDIYDSTAEAVEILVPKLKEQGYQIVSVSELAKYKGKQLELGKAYGEIEGPVKDE